MESVCCMASNVVESDAVIEQFVNEVLGNVLLATNALYKDDIALHESPCAHHNYTPFATNTCSHCMRFCGTDAQQVSNILGNISRLSQQPIPDDFTNAVMTAASLNETSNQAQVECADGCSAIYCSTVCRELARKLYHMPICGANNSAMSSFYLHPNIARNPDAHVAVRLLGTFLQHVAAQKSHTSDALLCENYAEHWLRGVGAFHGVPWSLLCALQQWQDSRVDEIERLMVMFQTTTPFHVLFALLYNADTFDFLRHDAIADSTSPSDVSFSAADTVLITNLRETVLRFQHALCEPVELLNLALRTGNASHPSALEPYLSLPRFDWLCGVIRVNCVQTTVRSPLCPSVVGLGKSSSVLFELLLKLVNGHSEMLDANARGMNHSCQPNVEVLATSSDAAHIQVRTLRALSAGELLCPSYIDLNGIFFL